MEVTNQTLKELGVENIPIIYAYNKSDRVEADRIREEVIQDAVVISAKKRIGIDQLVSAIDQKVFTRYMQCDMLIPYGNEKILSHFYDHASIKATDYKEDGVFVSLQCMEADYEKYKQYVISIN
jgi:GTP-binding protein HflX